MSAAEVTDERRVRGISVVLPVRNQAVECVEGGWGRAVRAGLTMSNSELVGYANSARTSAKILTLMLSYALAYPDVVLEANRKIRDDAVRRFGSLLYNLIPLLATTRLGGRSTTNYRSVLQMYRGAIALRRRERCG